MAKPKSSGKRKGKQEEEKEKMEDHDVSYDKEDQITIEKSIDSRVHSYLIGCEGETIHKIMDKFEVDICFPPPEDPYPNIISITGLEDNCYKCEDHLLNLEEKYGKDKANETDGNILQKTNHIASNHTKRGSKKAVKREDQFTITVLINSRGHSYLIGLEGETIRKIMDKFEVDIRFPSAEYLYPNISITGLKDNCFKCTDYLLNLEEEYGKDEANETDGNVLKKTNNTPKDHVKRYSRKAVKRDSPPGFPLAPIAMVSLAIIAVAVLVAVFTGSADLGSFSESVKDSINEIYSNIFNFLESSANFISETSLIIFNFLSSSANFISETSLIIFKFLASSAIFNSETLSIIFNFLVSSTNPGFCNPKKHQNCDKFLLDKFRNLGLKYKEQSSETWRTLYAAAHDHVSYQPNPQKPIVIMMYRLKGGPNLTKLLEDIAEAYDSVLPPYNDNGDIIINGSSFIKSSPEETQTQIQDILENGFENKGQKVAIVHDFDKLHSCSVLTFHNYCNSENAPHKNVAIILIVTGTIEKLPSNPRSADLEKAVNELFYEKWKDCPEDLTPGMIDAVLSNIAYNVILLR